jgi:hypothetical protein
MRLWLLNQTSNTEFEHYSQAVVAAVNESAARRVHPDGREESPPWTDRWPTWVKPQEVSVTYLGLAKTAQKAGVVLAQYVEN